MKVYFITEKRLSSYVCREGNHSKQKAKVTYSSKLEYERITDETALNYGWYKYECRFSNRGRYGDFGWSNPWIEVKVITEDNETYTIKQEASGYTIVG